MKLNRKHINKRVIYTVSDDAWIAITPPEHGTITNIDSSFVYVRFDGRDDSIPVSPESLTYE